MLDANHRGDVGDGSIDSLECIYDEAVCAGGTLSGRPPDEERLHTPHHERCPPWSPDPPCRRNPPERA